MRFLYIILIFITVSCSSDLNYAEDLAMIANETNIELINDKLVYDNLIIQRGTNISDNFIIDTAFISGEWLIVTVSYSGGCENHSFKAYWSNNMVDSIPPETEILLTHDANNDFCEAYISQNLTINLDWLLDENINESKIIVTILNGSSEQNYKTE